MGKPTADVAVQNAFNRFKFQVKEIKEKLELLKKENWKHSSARRYFQAIVVMEHHHYDIL